MMSELEVAEKSKQRTSPLLEHLFKLKREDNRGPLAELRRGAGEYPNYSERVLRHVAPFFPKEAKPSRENALLMIATLFALHPSDHDADLNMGMILRMVGEKKGSMEAVERRFLSLLGASPDELATHLRHAVSLAEGVGVSIGWYRLLRDVEKLLSGYEENRQYVVRAWSRSFWSHYKSDDDESSES